MPFLQSPVSFQLNDLERLGLKTTADGGRRSRLASEYFLLKTFPLGFAAKNFLPHWINAFQILCGFSNTEILSAVLYATVQILSRQISKTF